MFSLKRLFYRGVKGATDSKNFRVTRKLTRTGNSYTVAIPPIVIEDLGLQNGVILVRKKNKLYIEQGGIKDE